MAELKDLLKQSNKKAEEIKPVVKTPVKRKWDKIEKPTVKHQIIKEPVNVPEEAKAEITVEAPAVVENVNTITPIEQPTKKILTRASDMLKEQKDFLFKTLNELKDKLTKTKDREEQFQINEAIHNYKEQLKQLKTPLDEEQLEQVKNDFEKTAKGKEARLDPEEVLKNTG